MKLKERLTQDYLRIKKSCAITTAASREFAPYLFNMLASLHRNFPDHPKVYVFDLGLTKFQRMELAGIPWVEFVSVPPFVPHWNLCWTWKPYVWAYPKEQFILHLDSGVLVLRSLDLWFLTLKKNGYLAFDQGQSLSEITPTDFIETLGLDNLRLDQESVLAAGVFGFDRQSFAGRAVEEALELAKKGLTLGWSKGESHRARMPLEKIERNCTRFRHDQTLINLTLRKHSPAPVFVRPQRKYLGLKSSADHPKQFLWHARRKRQSMVFALHSTSSNWPAFAINRSRYALGLAKSKLAAIFS